MTRFLGLFRIIIRSWLIAVHVLEANILRALRF